jgi:hypothetical protein
MGRSKPRTVSKLMEVANKFADGEDTYHNKRARSPEDDSHTDIAAKGTNLATMTIRTLITK